MPNKCSYSKCLDFNVERRMDGMYYCLDCDFVAKSRGSVNLHWEAKHGFAAPLNCEVCGKNYPSTNALRSHMSRYHRTKWSVILESLDAEIEKHIRKENDFFTCTQCGKSSSTKNHMKKHIETHLNIRHLCNICGKNFKTTNSLYKHNYVYHKNQHDPLH